MTRTVVIDDAIFSTPHGTSTDVRDDMVHHLHSVSDANRRHLHLSSDTPVTSHLPHLTNDNIEHNSYLEVVWSISDEQRRDISLTSMCPERMAYTRENDVLLAFPNYFSYTIERATYDVLDVSASAHGSTARLDIPSTVVGVTSPMPPPFFELPLSSDIVSRIIEYAGGGSVETISLTVRRTARYRTRVYTTSTHFKKDVVIGVEIPMARLDCMFHYFTPFLNHPVMDIHHMYLTMLMRLCQSSNGHCLVSVCANTREEAHTCETIVRELFEKARPSSSPSCALTVHQVPNNPEKADGTSFGHMVEYVRSTASQPHDHYIFYGHTKGTSKYPFDILLPAIAIWSERMYVHAIGNIDVMVCADAPFGGCFMSTEQYEHMSYVPWHYSGSMYWGRQDMFHITESDEKMQSYYASEIFPGFVCPDPEACLCFCSFEHEGPILYHLHYHHKHSLTFIRDTAQGYLCRMFAMAARVFPQFSY